MSLLGYSSGANLILWIVKRHPEKVGGVLSLAPLLMFPWLLWCLVWALKIICWIPFFGSWLKKKKVPTAFRILRRKVINLPHYRYKGKGYNEQTKEEEEIDVDLRFVPVGVIIRLLTLMARTRRMLRKGGFPKSTKVLLVQGTGDWVVSSDGSTDAFFDINGGPEGSIHPDKPCHLIRVPGAGHNLLPHWQDEIEYNGEKKSLLDHTADFMDSV